MKAPQPAIRLNHDDVVREITSPGYFLPPPQIRHPDLIAPEIEQALRPLWNQGWFPPATLRLYMLEDVFVAGEGLVFTSKLRLVSETAKRHTHASITAARAAIETRLAANMIDRISGTTLLCRQAGAANYKTWLTELLPQAWLAAKFWPHEQRIMLQRAPELWHGVFFDTLAKLGFAAEKCLECGTEPVLVDRLLLIDGLISPAGLISPLVTDCLAAVAGQIAPNGPKLLFVSSSTLPADQSDHERRLLHEAHHAGFAVINPLTVPFASLAAAFKATSRVIGVSGPAMANMIFCRPDTDIITLTQANDHDTTGWSLAGLAGMRALDVRIAPDGMPQEAERAAMFEPTLPPGFMQSSRTRFDIEDTLSRLFDASFYQAQIGAAKKIDPLAHFMVQGWQKGVDPSAAFSTSKYLAAYQDVVASQMNPLMHYVLYGESEGRMIFGV